VRLKRADELKSRFLSYASHELRTPLNGIIGLTRLLLTRRPQGEELRQINYIQQAAQEMRAMLDDLLDLAKVEAGKITVHPSEVGLELVFGALRGIFRPLSTSDTVELHFENTSAVPAIYTDEGKVIQILQNFISNALKFTEHGEVRVWAELDLGTWFALR
jgi:signal transduction histidine kinase